ncbi:hypothetical protein FOMPIDRAFT_160726 [Fomitopsis schrenkii]|uniref:Uncharacterized protein n=1 Tax=Fomitopsis schrenkii TaxID=2126942 RepID=S8EBL1_FOMSC|nr:hypothetical protein FOMPIDRAFT_160726 [Fomitopsis schrenkii]
MIPGPTNSIKRAVLPYVCLLLDGNRRPLHRTKLWVSSSNHQAGFARPVYLRFVHKARGGSILGCNTRNRCLAY